MRIPAYVQYIGLEEERAVRGLLGSGNLLANGQICRRVEREMRHMLNVDHVLLTPSCADALELAMLVLDIGPGDEVIVPSFGSVASANCVVLRGATPVFADVVHGTLNINPNDVARRVTGRTKAIIASHYGGVASDMQALMNLARRFRIYVVENADHAIDSRFHGRHLGTIGHLGCFSFHSTQNITCGEGGAFVTSDEQLARKARFIHEQGTNRTEFLDGKVDSYTWHAPGSNYALPEVAAAILEVQLAKRDDIRRKRKQVWDQYYASLQPLVAAQLVELPLVPDACDPNYHIFFFCTHNEGMRNYLLRELQAYGIGATAHFGALHQSPFGRQFVHGSNLPQSERYARTLIRLPIYPNLSERAARYIVNTIQNIFLKILDSPLAIADEISTGELPNV